ncbi:MAG: hypothetical protein AB7N91_11650 [Candidatus Tectimicrobiota bacterium]
MKNWQTTIAAAAIACWIGTTVGTSIAEEHASGARSAAQPGAVVTTSTAPWQALQGLEATPLHTQEMDGIKGKGLTLSAFLSQATRTSLGSGVYVWSYSSDGNPFSVTATWNTGSSSGTGTVVK